MKVGTLVRLSAYGKKREFNGHVSRNGEDPIGIIVKTDQYPVGVQGYYRVKWVSGRASNCSWQGIYHYRRELKYAK